MFRRNYKKGFLSGSLFFIALVGLSAQTDSIQTQALDSVTVTDPEDVKLVSVIGVGDMMLGTNYPSASYLPANGGKDLLKDVEPILKSADLTFGNLEGTILDKGGTVKQCKDPSLCYAFRSPESYINHFVNAGFDLVSLANNHSGDFGPTGRKRTKEVLDEAGIGYAGLAGTDESVIIERNGTTFGLAAFAPNRGTCDIRQISRAQEIVKKLTEKADIVIVSFHGGAEGAKHQNVPKKTEYYYGENRGDVHKFAHAMVDAGADIIFGHGPHVTRSMELYKDRIIAYSLGNFCTYGRFNLRGAAGIAPILKVYVDADGAFVQGELTSVYQQKTHGPKVDSENRAVQKVIALSKMDFPNSDLHITPEGLMAKKK